MEGTEMSDVTQEGDVKSGAFKEMAAKISEGDAVQVSEDDVEQTEMSIRDVMASLVTAEDADKLVHVRLNNSDPFVVSDVDFDEDGNAVLTVG